MTERLTKHNYGLSAEYNRVSQSLQSLTECSSDTYAIDTNEIPLLNNGLGATAKHLSTNQSLLEDEARAWDLGVLEDLKRQRDALVSMRDMFDRRDKYSKDNIPQLERKIAANENKLAGIRAKPEHLVKAGEAEKVEDAIVKVRLYCESVSYIMDQTDSVDCRTKSRLSSNMLAESSSKNASGTRLLISRTRSITSAARIRSGARNVSSMPSFPQRTGGLWARS